MKYSRDGRLTRRILSRLFGKKNARPDEECFQLEAFVVNTMSGCGWDMRHEGDVMRFGEEFGFPIWSFNQPWARWMEGSSEEEHRWAVVEKRNGVAMWAWFQKAMLISEWAPVGEDTPVTKKLVPFKNGFFKTEPL